MNLLLVEDDAQYGATLAEELRALDHQVTLASTGVAGLEIVGRASFDAVILDRMLPHMDGTTVLRRLREDGRTVPVLMLSALGLSVEKVEGLDAGADDYVVKPTPAIELDARLKALVRARGWTASTGEGDTVSAGDIVVSPGQYRGWRAGAPLDLTRLELRLLVEFVRQPDVVLTRTMLLEKVWGYDFEPATNIVDAQIRSLRRKLTARGEDDPIVTKRGIGYLLQG